VVKFIEHNWHIAPLTARSRDNLPNPEGDDDNRYVPATCRRSATCSRRSTSTASMRATATTDPTAPPRWRTATPARQSLAGVLLA
jgi:hypothetical protein